MALKQASDCFNGLATGCRVLLQGALGLHVINKAPFAMMGALCVALIRPVVGERKTAAELNSSAKLFVCDL